MTTISKIKEGIIIVNGIRVWEEVEMIKEVKGKIVYITADSEVRWERIQSRGEKIDDVLSYERFLELEANRTEVLIPDIGKKADFEIENNSSEEEFQKKTKEIMKKI